MTKEDYQKMESELLEQEKALKLALSDLRKEYVSTNSPILVGTKVQVFNRYNKPMDVGILIGYEFNHGCVLPVVAKMKKDGTPHPTAKIYFCGRAYVEPME